MAESIFISGFAFSNVGKDTLPVAPASLRCGDGKQGYGLYWKDNSTNEVKFKVLRAVNSTRDFVEWNEIKSTSQANQGTEYFCKIDYSPENYYFYQVAAVNKSGNSTPSAPSTLPKRPTGLTIKADSLSVILKWTYPVDNLVNFVFIERGINPAGEFQIMSPVVNQGGLTYIDYSAEPGVNYYYRIRGVSYDSKSRITSYTPPGESVGPFKVSAGGNDFDGIVNFHGHNYQYKTFVDQTWMIENLAYLPEVFPSGSLSASEKRYYVSGYKGSEVGQAIKTEQFKTYGVLYNWPAASDGVQINPGDPIGVQGICPSGWHLPSNKEWVDLGKNLIKVQTLRDSLLLADAMAKGAKVYDPKQFIGDFAMPAFKQFKAAPGGFLRNDSIAFHAAGEIENYWSATNRLLINKGMEVAQAGKEIAFPVRCIKGPALPVVSTQTIAEITEKTARPSGIVASDGGAPVISRGFCWNTIGMPTLTDNNTSGGSGTGSYSCQIVGLKPGTIYYTRAYATNSVGTTYSGQQLFKTGGNGAIPSVTTLEVADILGTTTSMTGNISAFGGDTIIARGVCWNTKKKPTTANSFTLDRSGNLNFTGFLAGLTPLTTYYARAFATNSFGTAYGEELQFTTLAGVPDGKLDYKGRTYAYSTIGTQTWMTENLAYLPSVSSFTVGSNETPFYYVYGYEGSNVDAAKATDNYIQYGALYNWQAAKTACPPGWHLPGQDEMKVLTDYLTHYGYGRGGFGNRIAKSMASTTGWEKSIYPGTVGHEPATNNQSRFNAIPGGQCYSIPVGVSANMGKVAIFWSATENIQDPTYAFSLVLASGKDNANPYPNADKKNGFSVRCVKDK